jgi:hypothetical protein
MTPKTAALLADPHPQCHIVYPYTDDRHIAEAVSMYAAAGLSNGETVVLVTTAAHWADIQERLLTEGFDLNGIKREGRLVCHDAAQLLGRFHNGEQTDGEHFTAVIEEIIETGRKNSPVGKVRIYGEMVNLLCGNKSVDAAADLEDLWNAVIERQRVPLLCSYSLDTLRPHCAELPRRLVDVHTHVA